MEKPLDSYVLSLALCGWASKAYKEKPQNPLWRVVERADPDRLYAFEDLLREFADVPEEDLRRVWERTELLGWRDDKAGGAQIILAVLHLMMCPSNSP